MCEEVIVDSFKQLLYFLGETKRIKLEILVSKVSHLTDNYELIMNCKSAKESIFSLFYLISIAGFARRHCIHL
jgi:hypothetical protein